MLDWQRVLSQQLQQLASTFVHFVRARRRAEAAIGVAALLFWTGYSFINWLPPGLQEWVQSWRGNLIISGVLYIAGLIFLLYGSYLIWQLVYIPDLLPVTNRPSAIKGPDAFTPADGELFRKLGREDDLRKLLGYIEDDQVRLIVLMGESGAGKTSLLRAGLTDILKDKDIGYHYWEAVSNNQGKTLLRAIQESWRSASESKANSPHQPAPTVELRSLEQLINPSSMYGIGKHVVVLDQFEQLRGATEGPVFQLLRKVARDARPPHLVTWIVAFRREFRANWSDFIISEQEQGFYPREISLQLFTEEQAHGVIGQLSHAAGLMIDQKVVDSLIGAASVNGKVSPVDIGIGLQVLSELREQRSGKVVTDNVYHFAGGDEGLLMQYIEKCLDSFLDEDRESILNAMLALRDPETNQRIAEGKTCAEVVKETRADFSRLRTYLEHLTQRNMRLLEHVTASDGNGTRYRLAHERLIPALNRLSGKMFGKKEEAKLKLEHAFSAWRNSKGKSQYLLRTRELRLVEQYRKQIRWGKDKQEKLKFLKRSQRRRAWIRSALVAGTICLVAGGWLANRQYELYEAKKNLKENHYPPELFNWQPQLKSLELSEPYNGMHLPWLRSDTLEELTIKATKGTSSLAGLEDSLIRCPALKDLTLDLSDSQVTDLTPLSKLTNLTQLTIIIEQADSLEPLSKLTNLTHLKLTLSYNSPSIIEPLSKLTNLNYLYLTAPGVNDLELLSKLTNLTGLILNLTNSRASSLEPLSKLTNLTDLYLITDKVDDLKPLSALTNLRELTVRSATKVNDLEPLSKLTNLTKLAVGYNPAPSLKPLSNLTNLTSLKISMDGLKVSNFEPLSNLVKLTRLDLDLSGGESISLEPLSNLTNLTQLHVNRGDEVRDLSPLLSLPNLAELELGINQMSGLNTLSKLMNLSRLTLSIGQLSDLQPLSNLVNLRELKLDIQSSSVSDLKPLSKLVNLNKLDLRINSSQVKDFKPLSNLTNLTQLSLSFIKGSNLEALSSLINLTELDLRLSVTSVSDLKPLSNLINLTKLELDLGVSEVRDLEPLSNLTNLTNLDLKIGNNPVSNLEPLSKLTNLTQLNLDLTYSKLRDFRPLIELTSCQALVLVLTTDQRMTLKAIPKKVTYLNF